MAINFLRAKIPVKVSQQSLLEEAIRVTGENHAVFAKRIGATPEMLQSWLSDRGSEPFRAMPEAMWPLIGEILRSEIEKA